MLKDVVGFLRCPVCGGDLSLRDGSLRCTNRHAFDVARQGYVNLLAGRRPVSGGDTASMVAAREAFLGAGHYASLARLLADRATARLTGPARGGPVVDVGAGTGYYLGAVLGRLDDCVGLALDVSKYALRRAARVHPRVGAVACDVWGPLPVRSGSAALVLDVFAPRGADELHRVLRPDGALLVVTPTPRHLDELVTRLGLLSVDERKGERLRDALGTRFTQVEGAGHEYAMRLTRRDAENLVGMGPSAWHADPVRVREEIAGMPEPIAVTASFTLSTYRKAASAHGRGER